MFQKFHTDSIFTRFVKHLLETEYIPTLQHVKDGSLVVKGCSYIFGDDVVQSKITGTFNSSRETTYKITTTSSTARNFHSNVSWYDAETHKQLGNYLRHLRDHYNLNLLPYYNCYNGTELTDIYLEDYLTTCITPSEDLLAGNNVFVGSNRSYRVDSYIKEKSDKYRVVAIPVNYDTKYTIAVSCASEVLLRGIVYKDGNVSVDRDSSAERNSLLECYSDYLANTFSRIPYADFKTPFVYEISLVNSRFSEDPDIDNMIKRELYDRQDDLYLILQLPKDTKTSIVVIEGEIDTGVDTIHNLNYPGEKDSDFEYAPPESSHEYRKAKLFSLLQYNTGVSYAFSDRLVEYLLLNVIDETETLNLNIRRIQEALCKLYPNYEDRFSTRASLYGVWDDSISNLVETACTDYQLKLENQFDQDGRINKDIEQLLSNKGVYTT